MRAMTAIGLTLLSAYASPLLAENVDDFPAILNCKVLGSWGCNADGVCIDGPGGRGNYYTFSTKRMVYTMAGMIAGRITSIGRSPAGLHTLMLDDGRTFTLDFKKVGAITTSSLGRPDAFEELTCNDR
jgi:hypothetical protein